MKSLRFLLLLSLLLYFSNESKGQCSCPSGYTHTVDTLTFNGNCEFYLEYCFYCDPHTLYRSVQICSITIPWSQPFGCVLDGTDIGSQSFWENIYVSILIELHNNYYCGEYGPCTSVPCTTAQMPNRFVEIKKSSCFKKTENPLTGQTQIIPCETEAQCVIEYCVCWDGTTLHTNKLNSYEVGESECIKRRIGIGGDFDDPNDPDLNPYACFNPCY